MTEKNENEFIPILCYHIGLIHGQRERAAEHQFIINEIVFDDYIPKYLMQKVIRSIFY